MGRGTPGFSVGDVHMGPGVKKPSGGVSLRAGHMSGWPGSGGRVLAECPSSYIVWPFELTRGGKGRKHRFHKINGLCQEPGISVHIMYSSALLHLPSAKAGKLPSAKAVGTRARSVSGVGTFNELPVCD